MVQIVSTLLILAGLWKIFEKMGYQGWKGIVPFYNLYILMKELYGSGWLFLILLVPVANFIFSIKYNIDLVKRFNFHWAFGLGIVFLPMIFLPILGFGNYNYCSNYSDKADCVNFNEEKREQSDYTLSDISKDEHSNNRNDFNYSEVNSEEAAKKEKRLKDLKDLLDEGFITEEEYKVRKKRIKNDI